MHSRADLHPVYREGRRAAVYIEQHDVINTHPHVTWFIYSQAIEHSIYGLCVQVNHLAEGSKVHKGGSGKNAKVGARIGREKEVQCKGGAE